MESMRKIKIIGYGTYLPSNKIQFEDQTRYRIGNSIEKYNMIRPRCRKGIADFFCISQPLGNRATMMTEARKQKRIFKPLTLNLVFLG